MKHISHFNTAVHILQHYKGQEPFANFIKDFFRRNKKFGSKDRKEISHLCYCSFRSGYWLKNISEEDRILAGIFLCDDDSSEILDYFKPVWNQNISQGIEEKMDFISSVLKNSYSNIPSALEEIFPWKDQLSNGIDHKAFSLSFFCQPDLFIRIRPGYESTVRKKLQQAGINFEEISSSCLAFDSSTKLDEVLNLNEEAVIQDLNSQKTGKLFELRDHSNEKNHLQCWDCCAASGGKSLMLYDIYPNIDLTVSDIRKSALTNLEQRFKEAGINSYRSFTADLTSIQVPLSMNPGSFDLIIVDVPCSGSGTWARTPEALYFYDSRETDRYSDLQKKIISRVIPYLKKGGLLVYITCSVFKGENEEVIDFIRSKFQLRLENRQMFHGYEQRADSMFAARFIA